MVWISARGIAFENVLSSEGGATEGSPIRWYVICTFTHKAPRRTIPKRTLPLNTLTKIELSNNQTIILTHFDANHCLGADMYFQCLRMCEIAFLNRFYIGLVAASGGLSRRYSPNWGLPC